MDRTQSALFVCGLIVLVTSSVTANSGYLLVAPSTFRSGVDAVVSVTILQPTRPIHVSVKLYSDHTLISTAGHAIFGKGSLKLKVPSGVRGRATLKVCGNCISPKPNTFSFRNSTVVTILERGSAVFIQLDKPIYKPGQTVNLNIITTNPDLKPVTEDVFAYILDPHGTRVAEWNSLPKLCCGVVNTSFPLSDQPVLGAWTVFVKVQGHIYNKTFAVQKYVKPKFEVYVSVPAFITDWNKCEPVAVHAKYLFGRGVKGNLTASVRLDGVGYYRDYRSHVRVTTSKIDNGLAHLNVCVSDLIQTPVNDHFRGVLHLEATVTTPDGSSFTVEDNSCPVNKQMVDVVFSQDTKQHFKPGVPYCGKVLLTYPDGSLAENVTVQITSDVNGETKTVREFSSESGAVPFTVSALPVKSKTVWIEAKVLRIKDDDLSGHFLSTHMSVTNWYSPSKCHILLENKSTNMKPGDYAKIKVQSTCPCDFTFYHEVVSRGNIAHSGVHYAGLRATRLRRSVQFETQENLTNDTIPPPPKTCSMFFTLPISREMAPLSKLIVYYVRESGEGVADNLEFNVQHGYDDQIKVEFSGRKFAPSNKVNIKVKTKPDSCVCLATVDKSLHLLKPGFALSPEEILSTVTEFEDPFDQSEYPKHQLDGSHDPSSNFMSSKDAHFAFQDSGLMVLTDSVHLEHKQNIDFLDGPVSHRYDTNFMSYASLTAVQQEVQRIRKRKRTFFPETWIWQCFNVSSLKKHHTVSTRFPDSLTTWVTNAFSISQKHGLVLAKPISVQVTKDFIVDVKLPYSVKRGEKVQLPFTVHSYTDTCAEVVLKIKASGGNTFTSNRNRKYTSRFCVGHNDTVTNFTTLAVSSVGDIHLSVQAQAFADRGCCAGSPKYSDKIRRLGGPPAPI